MNIFVFLYVCLSLCLCCLFLCFNISSSLCPFLCVVSLSASPFPVQPCPLLCLSSLSPSVLCVCLGLSLIRSLSPPHLTPHTLTPAPNLSLSPAPFVLVPLPLPGNHTPHQPHGNHSNKQLEDAGHSSPFCSLPCMWTLQLQVLASNAFV